MSHPSVFKIIAIQTLVKFSNAHHVSTFVFAVVAAVLLLLLMLSI
jgi:hypothetical protein